MFLLLDNALAAVAKQNTVVVVGDTDILVLLIYHTKKGLKRHYMQPENTLNKKLTDTYYFAMPFFVAI